MKIYKTNEIKNITLVGNSGSGKTSLAEAMLLESGLIQRKGDINSKNTVSDYHEIEHTQENSVFSTVLFAEWNNKKINFIDAPGADDFVGGMVSALNVTETAVMVINATNGVEVGSEIQWRYLANLNKPAILVFNQLDHDKANFEKTLEDTKAAFGKKVTIVQYPVSVGESFDSVVDVLKMKMYKWNANGYREELDIPASEKEKADDFHNTLVEAAAENDDNLMELFFEKGSLNEDEMRAGIRIGLKTRGLFPVFCTSAKKSMGIQRIMDFITTTAPLPDELDAAKDINGTEVICNSDNPTSLFVFKTSVEQHLGEVLFFKVMSGKVTEGDDLINMYRENKERLSQLYIVAGKNREKMTELHAGDIGAAVKLKETKTNHTLNSKDTDVKFADIKYPPAKHRAAIKATNESDEEKLGEALQRIVQEDPTYILEYSKELKQLIIYGQGEFHLNTLKWHLNNEHNIEIEFITPKIPYRETITKVATADFRHKKQSGGSGQFGEVHLVIEPHDKEKPDTKKFKINGGEITVNIRDKQEIELDWGGKLVYYNCIVGGVIDTRYLPGILKGIMEKMENGPLTGSYARGIRVYVYDGKMHPVDSNEISFKIAGAKAFSTAFKKAGPKIMEPVYDVEVIVPSDKMGDVMSDLQGRRSIIMGMASERGYEKISVKVPLAEMNRYSTVLSSLTSGRATYTMEFAEYTQVPSDVQEKLLKTYQEEQEEE